MKPSPTAFFVVSLLGLAVSGAILILLVPPLFDSAGPGDYRDAALAAFMTSVFAAAALRWRPVRR